jgi:hypothetical protein
MRRRSCRRGVWEDDEYIPIVVLNTNHHYLPEKAGVPEVRVAVVVIVVEQQRCSSILSWTGGEIALGSETTQNSVWSNIFAWPGNRNNRVTTPPSPTTNSPSTMRRHNLFDTAIVYGAAIVLAIGCGQLSNGLPGLAVGSTTATTTTTTLRWQTTESRSKSSYYITAWVRVTT